MSKKRILYALQGTGNGHVARAREIIPILKKFGHVDVLVSGDQSEVDIGHEVKFQLKGLTFIYDRTGGISYFKTLIKNNLLTLIRDVIRFPVKDYNIVINDFEFTTAWACRWRGINSFGFGHQVSFLSSKVPRPKKSSWIGELILKWYAPCSNPIGLHFHRFDHFIEPPIIRSEIRSLNPIDRGHYTVYLPAFGDEEIVESLKDFNQVEWQVFSKLALESTKHSNVLIHPISNEGFIQSLESCTGLLTSAGFEGPSEALFLGKKVGVIPIKNQYEQYCNASGLEAIGVKVFESIREKEALKEWVESENKIEMKFPDQTEELIRSKIFQVV